MKSTAFRKRFMKHQQLWIEVVVRISLVISFVLMEKLQPFERKIHPDELWLYKNPVTESYVPSKMLWPIVVFAPIIVIFVMYFFRREVTDVTQALLSLTLALGINGIVTDIIKLTVGRPRPDFFWRCFPDGHANPAMHCTGDPSVITEGRKSFPSGHSSFSFASLGFISLYMAGKLGVFNEKGRGQSLRLLVSLLPLLIALTVALSRTCDYHHHWQDVLCGSLLGLFAAYFCYRQHYPSLDSPDADVPLVVSNPVLDTSNTASVLPFKTV
ncbi:hypothetical protein DAPPUDRAFT_216951 [Daphnia pulex]|uniref:Phosphatidic acid phosphatase type 2/haloperoxidase domain-containing protein n=1 Tax=Daphnia pulex TaxID=6669 RepID=E9HAW1_DAPPU|nr:hypothetical protein DAPPUDRAFT_216951 [Daphnia pulex]|eukprot:EFX71150.1 hypothetical protein DAPPUDRAFT_216951 [Daphnia pulex]